jgi:hypothetical protein
MKLFFSRKVNYDNLIAKTYFYMHQILTFPEIHFISFIKTDTVSQ